MAFPPTFDELVPADHTERLVDKIINVITFQKRIVKRRVESLPYQRGIQLSSDITLKSIGVWLCDQYLFQQKTGYSLPGKCSFHVVEWMSKPDHNTINRFRAVRLKHALRSVFEEVVKYLARRTTKY